MAKRIEKKKSGRYFRCPKCLEVFGPYRNRDVVFCPWCRTVTREIDEEDARRKPLFG